MEVSINAINNGAQLVSGAATGNLIETLTKKLSLGFLGNTAAGIVACDLGGHLLGATHGRYARQSNAW